MTEIIIDVLVIISIWIFIGVVSRSKRKLKSVNVHVFAHYQVIYIERLDTGVSEVYKLNLN
jgi:hypothetical protein